jgi:hypothetical protein
MLSGNNVQCISAYHMLYKQLSEGGDLDQAAAILKKTFEHTPIKIRVFCSFTVSTVLREEYSTETQRGARAQQLLDRISALSKKIDFLEIGSLAAHHFYKEERLLNGEYIALYFDNLWNKAQKMAINSELALTPSSDPIECTQNILWRLAEDKKIVTQKFPSAPIKTRIVGGKKINTLGELYGYFESSIKDQHTISLPDSFDEISLGNIWYKYVATKNKQNERLKSILKRSAFCDVDIICPD